MQFIKAENNKVLVKQPGRVGGSEISLGLDPSLHILAHPIREHEIVLSTVPNVREGNTILSFDWRTIKKETSKPPLESDNRNDMIDELATNFFRSDSPIQVTQLESITNPMSFGCLLNGGNPNMGEQTGTIGSPISFEYISDKENHNYILRYVSMYMGDNGGFEIGKFGSLDPLPNGVLFQVDGVSITMPWKTNADIYQDFTDVRTVASLGNERRQLATKWALHESLGGVGLEVPYGAKVEAIIQDDLQGLDFFYMKIHGYYKPVNSD